MKSPSEFADIVLEPMGRTSCGAGVDFASAGPPKVGTLVKTSLLGWSFPLWAEFIDLKMFSSESGVFDSGELLVGLKVEAALLASMVSSWVGPGFGSEATADGSGS